MRKAIFLFIISFFGIFSVFPTRAQQTWTLDRCIDHALRHNLDIKLQALGEGWAAANIYQSYGNLLPTLDAYSWQGFNYGRTVDRFTNEFVSERVFLHNLYAGSTMTLFSGFQNINQIRYQNSILTALRHDTEKMKNDLILAIAGAYLQILYHYDMVEVSRSQLAVIEQQLQRTRIMLEAGSVPRGALLEMEAQLARERVVLQQLENQLKLSRLELVHLLQLNSEQEFLVARPDLDVDPPGVLLEPGQVYRSALQNEPSVLAAAQRIDAAGNSLSMARGMLSPRLFLNANMGTGYSGAAMSMVDIIETGTYQSIGFTKSSELVTREISPPVSGKKPYRDQLRDNYNTQFSLGLSIPILNRFQARTRISHARIELESARIQFEQAKYNLNRTIQKAHADAIAAFETYQATEKSLEAFEQAYRYAEQRFGLGALSSIEYNEARVRLAQAQAEAVQSKYQFIFMLKILEFYRGEGFRL